MKKLFYIAIFVLLSFVMISCKDDHSYSLNINSINGLRSSVVVNYTISDPNEELKESALKAEIKKVGSDTIFSSRDLVYNTTATEIKFSGLESGVNYEVAFYAGVDGKQVTLATREITTSVEGNSTESPYLIDSADDFSNILRNDLNGHYKLVADIDFAGTSINPMFTNTTQFTGTFDGNGYTISNFKAGSAESLGTVNYKYYGLFGYVGADAVIKNVKLDSFEFHVKRTSTTAFVALIAGYNAGTIEDVTVTNSSIYLEIDNSSSPNTTDSSGNLTGYYVGGLVGQNKNGATIKNCSVDVDITVKAKRGAIVGGICAINFDNSNVQKANVIENCKYNGTIDVTLANTSATSYETTTCVGGIIGKNYNAVSNCEVTGSVKLTSSFNVPSKTMYRLYLGGLVGWNASDKSAVKNSKVVANLALDSKDALEVYFGLLVGRNGGTGTVNYSVVTGCTYQLPENGTVTVVAFEGNEHIGLVGYPENTDATNKTEGSVVAKVTYYHTTKDAEDKDVTVAKDPVDLEIK